MPTIFSNPATFHVEYGIIPGSPGIVTFAVPAGGYVSGTWRVVATARFWTTGNRFDVSVGGDGVALPDLADTYDSSEVPLSTGQIADVNAAAGTDMTAILGFAGGMAIAFNLQADVSLFTLTLVGCSYQESNSGAAYDNGTHTGNFQVITSSSCGWTATSNSSWLHVTGGASGAGNGTVFYSVDANLYPGGARTGIISVSGGLTYTVTQSASVDPNLGTGATATLISGKPIYHPHTHAMEQFITVLYPHGYQSGVETNVGNLRSILWNFPQPRADVLCRFHGTLLSLFDLAGNELIPGTPIEGVDIWRWGY